MKLKTLTIFMALLLISSIAYSQNLVDGDKNNKDQVTEQVVIEPRELVQNAVDAGVLETPAAGCFDGDTANNEKDKASYAYDTELHLIHDFCAYGNGKEVLHEAYCNSENKVDVKEIDCPEGCKNGACVNKAKKEEKNFCVDTDSLNEGLPETAEELASVFGSKGATIGFYVTQESKYSLWEDYCTPDGNLVEYSCKKGKAGFITVNCACSEGKCNSPYCFDKDGGKNEKANGKTVSIDATGTSLASDDECKDEKTVTEFYCDGAEKNSIEIECQFGCKGGRCAKEAEQEEAPQETVPVTITCTSKTNCGLEEACINNVCTACNVDTDCGSGWKCDSGKCTIPTTSICSTDYDCDDGTYCSSGECKKILVSDKASFISALKGILARLKEYEKILLQAEAKHSEESSTVAAQTKTPGKVVAITAKLGSRCTTWKDCGTSTQYCNSQGKCAADTRKINVRNCVGNYQTKIGKGEECIISMSYSLGNNANRKYFMKKDCTSNSQCILRLGSELITSYCRKDGHCDARLLPDGRGCRTKPNLCAIDERCETTTDKCIKQTLLPALAQTNLL